MFLVRLYCGQTNLALKVRNTHTAMYVQTGSVAASFCMHGSCPCNSRSENRALPISLDQQHDTGISDDDASGHFT